MTVQPRYKLAIITAIIATLLSYTIIFPIGRTPYDLLNDFLLIIFFVTTTPATILGEMLKLTTNDNVLSAFIIIALTWGAVGYLCGIISEKTLDKKRWVKLLYTALPVVVTIMLSILIMIGRGELEALK